MCNSYQDSRFYVFILGTRYKRRGVNEDGHVANYVETEQVLFLLAFFSLEQGQF